MATEKMPVLGAILAGGTSRRMGRDKSEVIIGHHTMAEHVANALCAVAMRTVVVGREGSVAGVDAIADTVPGRPGPLAGLVTAFSISDGLPVLLVSVDQPFLRQDTLKALASSKGGEAHVPVHEGVRQVTCALYGPECLRRAEALLARGWPHATLQRLLDETETIEIGARDWKTWGEDGRSWCGIDTEDDLSEAISRYGTP